MANDTGDFELEPVKKTWAKETQTRGQDSSSKIVTIEVDSSMASNYELGETDVDSDLEAGGKKGCWTKEDEKLDATVLRRPISMKIREQVRAVDHGSYTPEYVPIGPYHVGRSSPRIEKDKQRCFSYLESLCKDKTGGGLMGVVDKMEPLARAWYSNGVVSHMTPEELSAMLLCDACYLLVCLVNYRRGNYHIADKLAHSSTSCKQGDAKDVGGSLSDADNNTVVRDILFLVENQIPFFLLQRIHERVTGDTTISALEPIGVFVHKVLQDHLYIRKKLRRAPPEMPPPSHLLHLLHSYLQPTMEGDAAAASRAARQRRPRSTGRWRRATESCKIGGVCFKRRVFKDDDEWTILDVHLEGGTLRVPRLLIDSGTWTILRNLMALEEQIPRRRPVTAYCVFMSQVACKVEDVELLRRHGILEHLLGSDEEVAQGFANLCKGVVFDIDDHDMNYLNPIWHELDRRCQNRVNRFMGWFCQFKYIWVTIALLVALIIIACQVTQTFYAVRYGHGGEQPKH